MFSPEFLHLRVIKIWVSAVSWPAPAFKVLAFSFRPQIFFRDGLVQVVVVVDFDVGINDGDHFAAARSYVVDHALRGWERGGEGVRKCFL